MDLPWSLPTSRRLVLGKRRCHRIWIQDLQLFIRLCCFRHPSDGCTCPYKATLTVGTAPDHKYPKAKICQHLSPPNQTRIPSPIPQNDNMPPSPTPPPQLEWPPLKEDAIPRSEQWYWEDNAGGHLYSLQSPPQHAGQMIRMLPEGFVHWCLKTFIKKARGSKQYMIYQSAKRYLEGLEEKLRVYYGSFLIPFPNNPDSGFTLDECDDKGLMKWILMREKRLAKTYPLFCQAVQAWMDEKEGTQQDTKSFQQDYKPGKRGGQSASMPRRVLAAGKIFRYTDNTPSPANSLRVLTLAPKRTGTVCCAIL